MAARDKTPILDRPLHEPGLGQRLLRWLAVYFGFQLPLVGYLPFFYLFPNGVTYWFGNRSNIDQPKYAFVFYLLYLLHFGISLVVPGRKKFRTMLIILAVLVILNVIGCAANNPHLTAEDLH